MKKFFLYINFAIVAILLVSCGKNENNMSEMTSTDIILTIIFVALLLAALGIIIYIIVRHKRNE